MSHSYKSHHPNSICHSYFLSKGGGWLWNFKHQSWSERREQGSKSKFKRCLQPEDVCRSGSDMFLRVCLQRTAVSQRLRKTIPHIAALNGFGSPVCSLRVEPPVADRHKRHANGTQMRISTAMRVLYTDRPLGIAPKTTASQPTSITQHDQTV